MSADVRIPKPARATFSRLRASNRRNRSGRAWESCPRPSMLIIFWLLLLKRCTNYHLPYHPGVSTAQYLPSNLSLPRRIPWLLQFHMTGLAFVPLFGSSTVIPARRHPSFIVTPLLPCCIILLFRSTPSTRLSSPPCPYSTPTSVPPWPFGPPGSCKLYRLKPKPRSLLSTITILHRRPRPRPTAPHQSSPPSHFSEPQTPPASSPPHHKPSTTFACRTRPQDQ